ncbi:hypothetical protein [Burkholderia stagnalis]|uniref:hypothetical protein n=1 Tax=Burkholderia stagnalis TaxID=1503054 RepID=UPI000F80F343|nr:hypothetical protein [Burkholderia stagnalis]
MATDDEIKGALRLIHRRANEYKGPLAMEFAEIARRSFIDEANSTGKDNGAGGQTERPQPKEQLADALALLLDVAFPSAAQDAKTLRQELSEILGVSVRSIRVTQGDESFSLGPHLARRRHDLRRNLENALREYIPREDELND